MFKEKFYICNRYIIFNNLIIINIYLLLKLEFEMLKKIWMKLLKDVFFSDIYLNKNKIEFEFSLLFSLFLDLIIIYYDNIVYY